MKEFIFALLTLSWLWVAAACCIIILGVRLRFYASKIFLPVIVQRWPAAMCLRRRAWRMGTVMLAALALLLCGAALLNLHQSYETLVVTDERRTDAVIVVDVSGSMSGSVMQLSSLAIEKVLRDNPDSQVGMVLFSDSAYQALPPARGFEGFEAAFLRYFRGSSQNTILPWTSLSGGTSIASGVVIAGDILASNSLPGQTLVVISDLGDFSPDKTAALFSFLEQGMGVRIVLVGIDPGESDLAHFQGFEPVVVRSAGDIETLRVELSGKPIVTAVHAPSMEAGYDEAVFGAALASLAALIALEFFFRRVPWPAR